ncbi:MAG: type II toxin-antitoxin system PemK/MazF family toxin [Chloroflexi bacterium]|nr:type II toxin-antitoxin system PemK/MazF family toxin [Chloroflexota bacterium]
MTGSDPTVFNPGDVILISYPFGEGAGVRKRPALVVSSSAFNQETGELVIAQITSRVSAPARAGDYTIAEWREAKLPRPALVRARLATLARSLVLRRLGSLSKADYQGALAALKSQLDG